MTVLDEVIESIGPDMYRRNIFRVLGLSSRASTKEVRRQQERMEKMRRLGIDQDASKRILPLSPAPAQEEVQDAMNRLAEPRERFRDEVFWLWDRDGSADPAYHALEQGDEVAAETVWTGMGARGGVSGDVGLHNLAVLRLVRRLDGNGRESDWAVVADAWRSVRDADGFWDLASERAAELDDARLGPGYVHRLRETVFPAVLHVGLREALDRACEGRGALAADIVECLKNACRGAEIGVFENALVNVLRPLRQLVQTAIDGARRQWGSAPQKADEFVRGLHSHCAKHLAVMDAMLSADDPVRQGIRDSVAEAISDGSWAFANKTCDWKAGAELVGLAKGTAAGSARRQKLDEELETLKSNAESGNDWCAPGYWACTQDDIDRMETARAKTKSGDFDGALKILLGMDPALGKILRRCVAHCLSIKGIRTGNAAWDDFDPKSSMRKKIVERLGGAGSVFSMMLINRPTPQTPSFMMPACPCCGGTYYTRWVNFQHNVGGIDVSLFMCSSCSEQEDREIADRKATLKDGLVASLELVLLADELDPGDAGIAKNLAVIRKQVSDLNGRATTSRIRAVYAGTGLREKRIPAREPGTRCHFCAGEASDPIPGIRVPMHGPGRKVALLFGDGVEYEATDLVVPRCPRCSEEHRQLPGKVGPWKKARDASAEPKHFPALAAALKTTEAAEKAAGAEWNGKIEAARRESERLESELEELAAKISTLVAFGWPERIGMAAAATLGMILGSDVAGSVLLGLVAAPVFAVLAYPGLQTFKASSANPTVFLQRKTREELDRNREAIAALEAERKASGPVQAREAAATALDAAVENARSAWEKDNPRPTLPAGIAGEETFQSLEGIQESRARKWSFGPSPASGGTPSDIPVQVEGLVGAVDK